MRTNWIPRLVPFSSRSSPRSFDMRGEASSSAVVVRLPSCLALLVFVRPASLCSSVVSACYPFRVLSSYRSAPHSFDKWDGAVTVCVSVLACLGRRYLLLAVAGPCDVAGRFPSPPLLAVWPFYRVGVVLSCRPLVLACLPSSSLVVCGSWRSRYRLRSCLASSPLLASPRRRGPSWADRRRVSSSWFLLVVGRRCSSSSCLLALGCRRRPCWPCGSFRRLVSSFALSPRIACRRAGRLAFHRLGRLVARGVPPWFRSFPAAGRLVPCPSSLLAFPSRLSCVVAAAVEEGRLGSGRAACLSCFGIVRDGVGVSCLRVACPRYEYRPVPLVVEAGRYFFSCRLLLFFR